MKPFCAALQFAGLRNVSSYIRSGNIIFETVDPAPEEIILSTLRTNFGLDRPVCLRTGPELANLIDEAPQLAFNQPKACMIYLHPGKASDDLGVEHATATERLIPTHGATFLWAPDGIGKSKLAAKLDHALPQPVTARNLNTIMAVHDRLQAISR